MTRWTPERWRRIQELLDAVLDLEPAARRAFLAESCRGEEELAQDVEAFLAQESELGDFIEQPRITLHPSTPEDVSEAGRRLGPYRFVRRLGYGGMGEVHLAVREDDYQARVAVKLIRQGPVNEEVARRFVHERQILAQLEHPYIARLLDGGTDEDGRPYFVMEYVEGERIDAYCDARTLSLGERLELFCKVSEAVAHAHRNLVVHRDLKPSNILVNESGDPKLLDFGIAKLLGTEAASELTEGLAPLTFKFASPEQLLGRPITTASDVYSLGVVLHQLLTGRLPWDLDHATSPSLEALSGASPRRPSTLAVTASGKDREDLDPELLGRRRGSLPRQLRRQLAGDLDSIVLKTLRLEPEKRYGSVDDLAEDVRRHLAGLPIRARKGTFTYRLGKLVRRRKTEVVAAAILFALGAALVRTAVEAAAERQRVSTVAEFLEEVILLPDPRRTPDSREILEEARQRIGRALGGEPDLQARVMDTLGRTYAAFGYPEIARSLIAEALAIRRGIYGEENPAVAESMINLGSVLRHQDEIREATRLVEDGLGVLRRHFDGRDDLRLSQAITNYAGLLKDQGDYAEAERLYRESLAMKERLYGERHLEVARSLANLGALLEDRTRHDEAEVCFRRALEIRRAELGPDDPELVQSLQHMARLLYYREEYSQAADLFQEVVEKRRKIFGARSLPVAMSLNNLAACLYRLERWEEAESLFLEALSMRLEELGEHHHDVAVSRRNLAAVFLETGRPEQAERVVRLALEAFHASRSPTYWRIADARSVLGASLAVQGRCEEARRILVESHDALLEDKGADSVYTRDASKRLRDLAECRQGE